jgi:hypothetical protein
MKQGRAHNVRERIDPKQTAALRMLVDLALRPEDCGGFL